MEKVNYDKGPKLDEQSILFRWILLILLAVAAKVLNKTEVMNIYTLVGKTVGNSAIINNFHSELIGMMRYEKKKKKKKEIKRNITKDKNYFYVWSKDGERVIGKFFTLKMAEECANIKGYKRRK